MKKWYKNRDRVYADAEKLNCEVVVASNNDLNGDIYYLVPKDFRGGIYRIISRSQSDCRGKMRYRVIYKFDNRVVVIDETTKHRVDLVRQGRISEDKVYEYLNGYYTLMEEKSAEIKAHKEAARISHALCDISGKAGHNIRQYIRRKILLNL